MGFATSMWECANCHSSSHMRQDNACLPSLVLDPPAGRPICLVPGATWGLAGSAGSSGLFWCLGNLAAHSSPCLHGWSDSSVHIAACSTWDEVWSLERLAPPTPPTPTSVWLSALPCGLVDYCAVLASAVLWVELHKTGAQPQQTSLFLFSSSTVLVHSFPLHRPGCLPSHLGAHQGKQTRLAHPHCPGLAVSRYLSSIK